LINCSDQCDEEITFSASTTTPRISAPMRIATTQPMPMYKTTDFYDFFVYSENIDTHDKIREYLSAKNVIDQYGI